MWPYRQAKPRAPRCNPPARGPWSHRFAQPAGCDRIPAREAVTVGSKATSAHPGRCPPSGRSRWICLGSTALPRHEQTDGLLTGYSLAGKAPTIAIRRPSVPGSVHPTSRSMSAHGRSRRRRWRLRVLVSGSAGWREPRELLAGGGSSARLSHDRTTLQPASVASALLRIHGLCHGLACDFRVQKASSSRVSWVIGWSFPRMSSRAGSRVAN
jgi:hypothetical protein